MKNTKTVSIGIPAFNEEANIAYLLDSIVGQSQKSIKIAEILVISDGSTDQTVELSKSIKDKRIKVIEDHKRLGKGARINQLMKLYKGDFLVLFDADVALKDKNAIEILLSSFDENEKIGIVCGNPIPLKSNSFIGKASNNLFIADDYIRNNFKNGHNIFSALGLMMALNKKLTRKIKLPSTTQGDDMFIYLSCKTKGFEYRRNRKARVYYRTPQSVRDFLKQSARHMSAYREYGNYFDQEMIKEEMTVPLKIKIRVPLYQAVKNPAGWIFLKLLAIAGREIGKHQHNTGIWDSVSSTKILF